MSATAPVDLEPLGDNWFAWNPAEQVGSWRVHAARHADGRLHLDALSYEGPVSAAALRSVPVGRIEAAVNALDHVESPSERRQVTAKVPDRLRANAVQGYPDEFYEVVARVYRALGSQSPRPVIDIAQANSVPTTTAQRWVKEARRRGLLPPGRPGKSG